jgi:hypothetical protein
MKERLREIKPSSLLATEVALAGLGLWYLKKKLNRASDELGAQEPITPPVVESFGDSTLYVYPLEMDSNGQPKGIMVGYFEEPGDSIIVSGSLEDERAVDLEENSETDPSRLKILMEKITEMRRRLEIARSETFDRN